LGAIFCCRCAKESSPGMFDRGARCSRFDFSIIGVLTVPVLTHSHQRFHFPAPCCEHGLATPLKPPIQPLPDFWTPRNFSFRELGHPKTKSEHKSYFAARAPFSHSMVTIAPSRSDSTCRCGGGDTGSGDVWNV